VAVSMSKQEFGRLEVLLRVQSGRLRVSDACVLIGLQRRQVFRLLRGLKQEADPATIGYPLRCAPWRCRWCGSGMPILARPWRRRSWQSITVARCHARPCVVG
jgi:hypothetical protein